MPNIKMQKAGAGRAYQCDANLPASDLERYTDNIQLALAPG